MIIKNNPHLQSLNIMQIPSPETAILSTFIFNAMIIPDLIPFITKGVKFKPEPPRKNMVA
jgi:potassium-transporting ATPase ATP-binding subunit